MATTETAAPHRFTLHIGQWVAMERHNGTAVDSSPVKILQLKPLKTGKRVLEIGLYEAFYPDGVRNKAIRFNTQERGIDHLAGRDEEDRAITFRELTRSWLAKHFSQDEITALLCSTSPETVLEAAHCHGGEPVNLTSHVRNVIATCALRFDGYAYVSTDARAVPGEHDPMEVMRTLSRSVLDSSRFHDRESDNFVAFFALQRFLCKWGGETLGWDSPKWRAYVLLFLHLYRIDPPPEFARPDYMARWTELGDARETTAAFVRRLLAGAPG